MIYCKHSSLSLDEVEARLREAVVRHKFGILHVHDLQQTLQAKKVAFGIPCKVFDVCNPQAASTALTVEMKISTVLPCRISLYAEGEGCTIATIKPTDLLRATELAGVNQLAAVIEKEILAMINEAA
jgi:uncharacterized protein (DUF302 family)